MWTLVPTPAALLHFGKDVTFPGGTGAVGIDLPAASDPLVAAALAADTPFPDRQLELGSFHVRAEAGQDFALGDGMGQVAFSGSASAFAGLGVYPDPAELLKALPLEDSIEQGLRLERTPEHQYLLLQWGYDAQAAVKGSLALGFGASATFGLDARSEGLLAVVRRVPKTTGALTAVASAVAGLRLPRQVRTAADLLPGCWVVAEVDGGIGVKLGAQFGYDFNWSRETKLGGLKEDIGLKLQLAVSAALGLEASGKYAVVVGRESLDPGQQKVRVQLLKLSKRGLSFAFNAGATVQANFSNLPAKADDFIKAVFDVHGAQIIDDLHAVEKWTDPNMSLSGALAGLTVDYGKELLTSLTGV
ncbi:MAG: hypothetical protein HY013_14035, partial [Candidatus Solibacter usitatus]|nr:hypothetical protein [Candidatus Solibacter usitatus]